MKSFRVSFMSVFFSTLWIILSEFVRNELLFKSYWLEHYKTLGIVFPSATINNMIWGVWSLLFAVIIHIIMKKFSFIQSCVIAWLFGFVLMWLVIGNLGVLPVKILIFAVPLSLLEIFGACWINQKLSNGTIK